MDISVNTNKVEDSNDKEPFVTYHSNIEGIKSPGYFKPFQWSKMFFNNLDVMYKHVCMKNSKGKYWLEIYDSITNYNDRNHKPLSNAKIQEVID